VGFIDKVNNKWPYYIQKNMFFQKGFVLFHAKKVDKVFSSSSSSYFI
jgi:hypothetical protein